jgi:hypothetical protein
MENNYPSSEASLTVLAGLERFASGCSPLNNVKNLHYLTILWIIMILVPPSHKMSLLLAKSAAYPAASQKAARFLAAVLSESDQDKAATLLGELVETHVEPLMRRVVDSRMRRHGSVHLAQSEDVVSDAVVRFLLHVEDLRQGRADSVERLDAFIAMLAARTTNDYFRRTHPAFHALRNRLRYLIEHYPDLARWKNTESGEWISGLATWKFDKHLQTKVVADVENLEGPTLAESRLHPADQLIAIFKRAGAPIRFNNLAVLMARAWNVKDLRTENADEHEFVDVKTPVDQNLGRKQWLALLWQQICELNRNQRIALLLNLKGPDGSCGTSLLVMTGVVSIHQMASAIDLPGQDFADLWQKIPLNDLEVGALLRLTRQQVINLRKCARQRLTRAMRITGKAEW